MSECRICLNSSNDSALITPCMCSGSIKYVHSHCLQHWLKEKYPNRYKSMPNNTRGCNTGLKCELCKYEFQGKLKFLGISGILKKLKETQALIYIIFNVPVVLYLIYKFNNLLRHLLNVSKSHIKIIKLQSSGCKKIFMLAKFYIRFLIGLTPVAIFGASAPTIAYSTIVLVKNLIAECQVFEIKSISGKMLNQKTL